MVYKKNTPPRRRLFLESLPSLMHLYGAYQKNKQTLPDLGGFTAPYMTGLPHAGPGNRIYPEKISERDEPYRQHDLGYSKLPWWKYFVFNTADAKLMSDLSNSRNPVDMAVSAFFGLKGRVTGKTGVLLEVTNNMIKQLANQFGWDKVQSSALVRSVSRPAARSFRVPDIYNNNNVERNPRDFRPTYDPIPAVEPQRRVSGSSKIKSKIYYTRN